MAYAAELDDIRQEVRRGYASNSIRYWPKRPDVGNVAVTGTPTYSLFKPTDSDSAIVSGSVTVTDVGGVDRLDITVDATDTDTYQLAEHFAAVITWTYGGVAYVSTVRFDCVLEPVSDAFGVSLNDLVEEVSDMAGRVLAQADVIDDGRTAEAHATIVALKAWQDVRRWVKSHLEARGSIIPRLIVDREALRWVVVAQAVARVYRAEGGGLDSESRALAADWSDEAQARFAGLGPLKYDDTEDRTPDDVLTGWGTVQTRRAW